MPSILRRKTKESAPAGSEKTSAEPARKRASSAGRSRNTRSRTSASATTPATKTATKTTATSRGRRSPRSSKTAARGGENGREVPAEAGDPELTTLLARQNALLESLIGVQERNSALLADLAGRVSSGREPGGIAPAELTVGLRPRLAIFVDVPNILYAAERSGIELDWGKIAEFLSEGRTLVRAMAYAPISDDPNARMENERFVVPFVDHGYRIVTKPLKRFSGGGVKANFDVELALDILTLADRLDVVALVSGDGDFRRLVEIVASRGVRVEVVAFGQSTAADLRAVADRYIDIAAYVPEFSASPK